MPRAAAFLQTVGYAVLLLLQLQSWPWPSQAGGKGESLLFEVCWCLWLQLGNLLHGIVLIVGAAFDESAHHLAALDKVGSKLVGFQVLVSPEHGLVCAIVVAIELQDNNLISTLRDSTTTQARIRPSRQSLLMVAKQKERQIGHYSPASAWSGALCTNGCSLTTH